MTLAQDLLELHGGEFPIDCRECVSYDESVSQRDSFSLSPNLGLAQCAGRVGRGLLVRGAIVRVEWETIYDQAVGELQGKWMRVADSIYNPTGDISVSDN